MRYFNREGDEINERSALDRHGIMRDGIAMRVPLQMRDAASRVTDAHLHRPGFRVGDGGHRDARQQALRRIRSLLVRCLEGPAGEQTNRHRLG